MGIYKWITNVHRTEESKTIHSLTVGHEGKRQLSSGHPRSTDAYTEKQLDDMGMIGIWQNGKCDCAYCSKSQR